MQQRISDLERQLSRAVEEKNLELAEMINNLQEVTFILHHMFIPLSCIGRYYDELIVILIKESTKRETLEKEIMEMNETREEIDRRRGMNSGGVSRVRYHQLVEGMQIIAQGESSLF